MIMRKAYAALMRLAEQFPVIAITEPLTEFESIQDIISGLDIIL